MVTLPGSGHYISLPFGFSLIQLLLPCSLTCTLLALTTHGSDLTLGTVQEKGFQDQLGRDKLQAASLD